MPSFLQKILGVIKGSLRAKLAAFFLLFALLIVIEMMALTVLRKKALALPRQIELVLDAQYYFQESRLALQQKMAGIYAADPLENQAKARTRLQVLHSGGTAQSGGFAFLPLEGEAQPTTQKLLAQLDQLRTDMVTLIALQSAQSVGTSQPASPIDSLAKDSLQQATTAQPAIGKSLLKTIKTIDNQAFTKNIKTDFDLLIDILRKEMGQRQSTIALLMGVIGVFDISLLGFFFVLMSRHISGPLHEIAEAAKQQSKSTTQTDDEIGVVAANLNGLIGQLQQATTFIKAIGEGQLDAKLEGTSAASVLSQSLLAMQAKLVAINEEEQKRKWANEGLTKFVDIIRSGGADLATLGDNVIQGLVTYTGSTQGGLYVWNDDDAQDLHLELIAAYAYNRKKYEERKIKAGEGLLGQTYLEELTTYLTEIPANYFKIVSGLGEMDPQAILIVPLLSDKKVYGLVELASLKPYAPHEIAFVERLGETIASTLSSVKTNERNGKLLQDFQVQTETMRAQEEEMRQNMEELTATQEEMARKEQDYVRQIEQLKLQLAELTRKMETSDADGQWAIAKQASDALEANLKTLEATLGALRSN